MVDRDQLSSAITRLFDAFNSYDTAAYVIHYAEDAVLEDTGLQRVFKGRDEIAEFMRSWVAACPDTHVAVGDVIVGDGKAAVAWVGTGTLTGDFPHMPEGVVKGSRITSRAVTVLEFDDAGLIKHHADYYDSLALLRQIGVLPA